MSSAQKLYMSHYRRLQNIIKKRDKFNLKWLNDILAKIHKASNSKDLESLRHKYVGGESVITLEIKKLSSYLLIKKKREAGIVSAEEVEKIEKKCLRILKEECYDNSFGKKLLHTITKGTVEYKKLTSNELLDLAYEEIKTKKRDLKNSKKIIEEEIKEQIKFIKNNFRKNPIIPQIRNYDVRKIRLKKLKIISKIKIENKNDLLRWTLDMNLFNKYYPELYNEFNILKNQFKNKTEIEEIKFKNLLLKAWGMTWKNVIGSATEDPTELNRYGVEDFIITKLNDDDKEYWKISEELPSVSIFLSDGTIQKITNKSILRFNGSDVDSATCTTDGKFVYLIIDRANGQAGSLGIWDPEINNWTFAHSDEMFIVEKIQYDLDKDEFLGKWFFSYPHSPASGEGSFRITKERKLIM